MFKLNICETCASELRAILKERGEDAMAEALAEVLCEVCIARVPGYEPGRRLQTRMKRVPPTPHGRA